MGNSKLAVLKEQYYYLSRTESENGDSHFYMQLNIPGYTLNHTSNLSIDGTGAVHTLVKNIYIMPVFSSNVFFNNEFIIK